MTSAAVLPETRFRISSNDLSERAAKRPQAPGTAKVALRAANGDALAAVIPHGRGRVFVQLFHGGLEASSLPRTTAFVPMVQQAAAALAPEAAGYMVAGHRSTEPGAAVALRALDLAPLLDLGLHLGEGTGALLAVPLVGAAARVLHSVVTIDELPGTG